ncbi:hypothetical protein DS901_06135 [Loktanella sp. D2R18]|uniref:hypothetical protein n=1 Tax=Rhodobacterales TaxID=204455 RepID=UPI000DEB33B6|nr:MULTISPECIES: hypothetical protein [Rhodobacterales]MDO6592068.1 hypothetical protein [Yoonia sp. 1_MG-2023]RBW44802.1 hypothetical protein DS901_06135 [Loktanella sp. D2R18]
MYFTLMFVVFSLVWAIILGIICGISLFVPHIFMMSELLLAVAVPMILATNAIFNIFPTLEHPVVAIPIMISLWLVLSWVIQRLPPKVTFKQTAHYFSKLSSQTIWEGFLPTPNRTDQHFFKQLLEVTVDPINRNTLHAKYAMPFGVADAVIRITDNKPFENFTYTFDLSKPNLSGRFWVNITDTDNRRSVDTAVKFSNVPFFTALSLWLGDAAGDQLDYVMAQEKGLTDYSVTGYQTRHSLKRLAKKQRT